MGTAPGIAPDQKESWDDEQGKDESRLKLWNHELILAVAPAE